MEVVRFPSRGGFSVRSIFVFALTVFITAILWATLSTTTSQAQAQGGAWTDGGTILYDGHGYTADTDIKDPTGTIPSGAKIYKTAIQAGTGTTSPKIFIIYYSSGLDPPTATSARYVEFNYSNNTLSNPQNARDIAMTPQGSTSGLDGEVATSCAVGGIGWIICPVSVFLAEAMDNLFSILAGMIEVQPPILGDENNSMYVAWNVMRSIANVAFVIVFLIIIFSQLTSIAVSNYGLKRLVPRLIIAAILVNISFYIAAIAIDLSNIAGYSVQAIFNGIRENLFSVTNDNLSGANTNTWSAVTAIILAGGGAVGGVYYMATGGLYLLVPLLIGLALTILFVVLIFAARQAIILILVIIAPIAFVANLLPNTEKWFEKWKDLFFTMLIFFPAFALVFGGSQLAGQIIIQNAGDNVVTLLFGMAVQVAPLVITPLILKLSGGLLGRIAQIANNPRKGVLDRSRNWAEKRAEHAKYQNIKRGARWYNPSSYGAGMVRRADFRKRRLADNTEIWKQGATNLYEETNKFGDISERKERAEIDKKGIHAKHAAHLDNIKSGKSTNDKYGLYGSAIKSQSQEEKAETAKNAVSTHYNELRVRGSSALRSSSYDLEMSKIRLDGSDKAKTAYYTNQKSTAGTRLNSLVEEYETTKVRLEGAESRYTTMVDGMKINPRSTLNGAVQTAQSAKQQAETAQVKLQAYFDAQNRDRTTVMGASYVDLERAKISGEGIKAQLTDYTADLKTKGGALHVDYIATERLKQAQQVTEAKLTRTVEEYRAGGRRDDAGNIFIDGQAASAAETALANAMLTNAENLSAETQGAQSAQREREQRISSLFAEQGNTRAEELLKIAGSVDDNGSQRALATALAQRSRSRKEVIDNIQAIFNFRNFTDMDINEVAQGGTIAGIETTHDTRAAAIQSILSGGNAEQIVKAMKNIDFSFPGATEEEREELQIIASDALMGNSAKPPFMTVGYTKALKSGKDYLGNAFTKKLGEADPGQPANDNVFNDMIINAINNGKIDSKKMQGAGKDYMQAVFEAMDAKPDAVQTTAKNKLLAELAKTLDPRREASEGLADSLPFLQNMVDNLGGELEPDGSVRLNQDGTPKRR